MHLRRIELTNYRQHRKLDIDFSGNLIAVLGRNGCGKSNLIGAIQFALTGEHPGATKADLTTWGEKEGSVRLFFTAGSRNDEFVIVRKTNGDVTLKVGNETVKQARKVEEALREKAGLDKELIRQIVFVPQKGIDSILFDDPKNREVAFQRLIGIGNASKIYESLGKEISAYDKPQGFDEAIAKARQQLDEQKSVADTCRNALDRYDEAIKSLPSKEKLESEVDKCASVQSAISEHTRLKASLGEVQRIHEETLREIALTGSVPENEEDKLREERNEATRRNEELRKQLDENNDVLKFLQRLKELSDDASIASVEKTAAKDKLDLVLAKYKTTLAEDKAETEKLGAEQTAAEAELRSLRNLMKDASSDGTCPVCGAPASQEDIAKHLEERLSAAEKTANEAVDKAMAARMAFDHRHAEEQYANDELARRQSTLDAAKSALKRAKDKNVEGVVIDPDTFSVSYKGRTPVEIHQIKEANAELTRQMADNASCIAGLDLKIAKISAARASAKELRDTAAKLSAQIEVLVGSLKENSEKLAKFGIDENNIKADDEREAMERARRNLDAYNGILRDMAAEKGRLSSTEETIEKTRKFIDDLVEKKELEEEVKGKVDTLKRVRDWFHYREGPRIMSQNVMRDLTACVNSYLDQFYAPFVVEAEEEGFGFRCRFIDGRTMPDPYPDASLLSGGQKVALAIAFRMAIYMCFGGELGLLSLDEPTAYLDDASIEHLGELLQRVGEVARNKGLQILMATHEKAIMPFLDTKIDLGAMKGE